MHPGANEILFVGETCGLGWWYLPWENSIFFCQAPYIWIYFNPKPQLRVPWFTRWRKTGSLLPWRCSSSRLQLEVGVMSPSPPLAGPELWPLQAQLPTTTRSTAQFLGCSVRKSKCSQDKKEPWVLGLRGSPVLPRPWPHSCSRSCLFFYLSSVRFVIVTISVIF